MRTLLLSFFAMCSFEPSFAANERGNGGKLVVCNESGQTTYRLLDLFEAQDPQLGWNLTLDLGSDSLGVDEKVTHALNRMARVDPDKSKLLSQRFAAFYQNTRFLSNSRLSDIPDVGLASIPPDCRLVQLAVQKTPELPGQKLYTIDNDYWVALGQQGANGKNQQAALILHELVYGLSEGRHSDSSKIRFYTAHITSTLMQSVSASEFEDITKTSSLPLPSQTFGNFQLKFSTIVTNRDGSVEGESLASSEIKQIGTMTRHIVIYEGSNVRLDAQNEVLGGVVNASYYVPNCSNDSARGPNGFLVFGIRQSWGSHAGATSHDIEFNQNGLPKKITASVESFQRLSFEGKGDLFTESCNGEVSFYMSFENNKTNAELVDLEFYESGRVKSIKGPFGTLGQPGLNIRYKSLEFSGNSTFFANNRLESSRAASSYMLTDRAGEKHLVNEGATVWFDDDGYFLRAEFQ